MQSKDTSDVLRHRDRSWRSTRGSFCLVYTSFGEGHEVPPKSYNKELESAGTGGSGKRQDLELAKAAEEDNDDGY